MLSSKSPNGHKAPIQKPLFQDDTETGQRASLVYAIMETGGGQHRLSLSLPVDLQQGINVL